MSRFVDLTGKRFGKLTVIKRASDYIRPSDNKPRPKYLCKCDCGNYKEILGTSLKNGVTKSCGCLMGHNLKTHSFANKERLYAIWRNIRERCNNKNNSSYKYYGAKGIKYCKEWENYLTFRTWALNNGYGDNLTIDRIDNKGDYEPSNCRWATWICQANNKGNNRKFVLDDKEYTIPQLAKLYNINQATLLSRIKKGWDIKTAVETPVYKIRSKLLTKLN